MELDYCEIGRNVKLHRIQKKLKQAQLAELINVSAQHISHIECGHTKLSLPVLVDLAEALSADFYTLLGNNIQRPSGDDIEFASIMKNATQARRAVCLRLCKEIVEL